MREMGQNVVLRERSCTAMGAETSIQNSRALCGDFFRECYWKYYFVVHIDLLVPRNCNSNGAIFRNVAVKSNYLPSLITVEVLSEFMGTRAYCSVLIIN